MLVAGH